MAALRCNQLAFGHAELAAGEDTLTFAAYAQTPAELARVEQVIAGALRPPRRAHPRVAQPGD